MDQGILPLPILLLLIFIVIIVGYIYVKKSWDKEPRLFTIGILLIALGVFGNFIVTLREEFHQFRITEIVSLIVLFTGLFLLGVARYATIKNDPKQKRRFLNLLGVIIALILIMFTVAFYGYFFVNP